MSFVGSTKVAEIVSKRARNLNKRVLAQAQDESAPLLERLRFLCISCTNLDEFFEIRVAGLKQRIEIGAPAPGPEKLSAQQTFDALRHRMLDLVEQQYRLLNDVLFPEMKRSGVRFLKNTEWSEGVESLLY